MKIKDIGGEFALIKRIAQKVRDKNVKVGIGDDCAVLSVGGKLLVITTDTLVENDHFSLKWFNPEQIGMKAVEINASDVGSMGGKPKYALVSLVLTNDTKVEFIDDLYKGMRASGRKHGIEIIGGNITHGRELVIDICMIGEVAKKDLKLRSSAKVGDYILVSGPLGGSTAGLKLFLKGIGGHSAVKKKHVLPKANYSKVKGFLSKINAMIDVSDGLGSEVTRICEQSKVGAVIFKDNVPISDEVKGAAHVLGHDALDYALFGGEDFELVYTVSEKNLSKVKGYLVGQITKKKGVRVFSNGKEKKLSGHGYDHFKL
ncbi:MAG: thiamine-phosphate kinase [Candidatus Woesearchaeota archaeon]|jgi:thiamine-monophosphate kinase|nr:thiamine-phosphate kinase [Candidatus Woesearchaeota archaeon]MDP7323846.1 thiamine-phosphate kinase [Candidatus Woesearchaeota archaeon]